MARRRTRPLVPMTPEAETLLRFAGPMLGPMAEADATVVKRVLELATLAWNLGLLDEDRRAKHVEPLRSVGAAYGDFVDLLLKRRVESFADDPTPLGPLRIVGKMRELQLYVEPMSPADLV